MEIERYDGPVFVDFTLPTNRPCPINDDADHAPLTEDDIEIGDVPPIAEGELVELPRARRRAARRGHDAVCGRQGIALSRSLDATVGVEVF